MKIDPNTKAAVLIGWAIYMDTLDEEDKRRAMALTEIAAEGGFESGSWAFGEVGGAFEPLSFLSTLLPKRL